jgi:cholesterol oxidase
MIDPYCRVHGYQGLHIADGPAVSASLDVNPALTITPRPGRAAHLAVPLPRSACPRR